MADIIAIEPNRRQVQFIHCKFSKKPKAGNRILDWNELFAQCARSHAWIRRGNLLKELEDRIDRRAKTEILSGMGRYGDLQSLASDYKANEWQFDVGTLRSGRRRQCFPFCDLVYSDVNRLKLDLTAAPWGTPIVDAGFVRISARRYLRITTGYVVQRIEVRPNRHGGEITCDLTIREID